jgi:hypothetical protein
MERPKRWCHRRAYLKQASNNRYAEAAGDCWVETEGTTVRQHEKTEDCGRGYGSTVESGPQAGEVAGWRNSPSSFLVEGSLVVACCDVV